MIFDLIPLMFAFILSTANYITEHIISEKLRKNKKLISFSAGVAVSYIILNLFPEISSYASMDGKIVFLYVLLGFISLNLIEQYVYKRAEMTKIISAYHKSIHVTYFFIYNILIGIVLAVFAYQGLKDALLFFIPFLLYIIFKVLPQEFKFQNQASKIIYSMAPMFGVFVGATYILFVKSIFGQILSLITGTLLYSVIRESLPSDKAEKPLYFLMGVSFYTVIILASWNL